MRRAILFLASALAIFLGVGSGEYLTTDFSFRRALGRVVRRGELVALANRHGIYDRDVERAWDATLFANGRDPADLEESVVAEQKRAACERLIEEEKLRVAAAREPIDENAINHGTDLLRWQFVDEKTWVASLRNAATSERALRSEVAVNLRDRAWLEAQVAAAIAPNDDDCRAYYDAHRGDFQQPARFRASHLFLAAPAGYPSEVIEAKQKLINTLSLRLQNGESFETLVTEFSEDEATRKRGGDLNYFGAERMLPEVFAAAQKLRAGELSGPIRSRLGFHLIRLTEALPAREMTFTQSRPEIVATLENERRGKAVASRLAALDGKITLAPRPNRLELETAASPNETADQ